MKATEQYFPLVMFIMLYKLVLIFESMDEILKCNHSNKKYMQILCCYSFKYLIRHYYAVQSGFSFLADEISEYDPSNENL